MTILIEAAQCVLVDEEDARQYVLSAFDALRHPAPVQVEDPRRATELPWRAQWMAGTPNLVCTSTCT